MIYRPNFAAILLALLSSLTVSSLCRAQTPVKTKKAVSAGESSSRDKADPMLAVRRRLAVSLLNSLADEARTFRDEALRTRAQAGAADALWESDRERAVTLFRRAWEAAEVADAAAEQYKSGTAARRPNLRADVLFLVRLRDPALAEEFLDRLSKGKEGDVKGTGGAQDSSQPICVGPTALPPPAFLQRLDLSMQLVRAGDIKQAMQFAAPALNCVTLPTLRLLTFVRTKDQAVADQAYERMLAYAANDPASDANTVSLLSSYAFTPYLFITVGQRGNINTSSPPVPPPAPDLPPALRAAFFRSAIQILLRPLPPPNEDRSSAGRAGKYFMIKRLLPLFEQYAPDTAPTLNALLGSLTADAPNGFQAGRSEWLSKGLAPEGQSRDSADDALDYVDSVTGASERDAIYANAALRAIKDYARASELIGKISDTDLRQRLRAYLDFNTLLQAIGRKDAGELVRLAREGQLTPIQRVLAFTEAAGLTEKDGLLRAAELLDEALVWARRIDNDSPDRARSLVAIATRALKADRSRTWEIMPEAVKAANAAADFTGEDTLVAAEIRVKSNQSVSDYKSQSFALSGLFRELARDDMNRAVELAQSFAGESPRALSIITISRAVLEERSEAKTKAKGSR